MKTFLFLALVTPLLCQETPQLKYKVVSVEEYKSCSSTQDLRTSIHKDLVSLIDNIELLTVLQRPCGCGAPGWRRVAYLNMSDVSQNCPGSWSLITDPKRSCGRPSNASGNTCFSAFFSTQGITYSRVCGRIIGYQFWHPDAFYAARFRSINEAYVDGASLTYGNPRHHIWTFANARDEIEDRSSCPCTDTNVETDIFIPSYVGQDYFCETGTPPGRRWRNVFEADDPLWDGQGCGPSSSCCIFNNPPWFCKHLPQPASDDLEIRLCSEFKATHENTPIELVEIFVM